MTTIAVRDGWIAADSLISYCSYNNGTSEKIVRVGRFYVALAGPAYLRIPLEEWVEAGVPDDAVPDALMSNRDQFSALFLRDDGRVFEFNAGFLLPVNADYTAIGSGGMFAFGALAHGASAVEAVAASCKHDKSSGGLISSFHYSSLLSEMPIARPSVEAQPATQH